MAKISPDDSILIVGAGVFGLSTALSLTERGFMNITIIDRYPPPVPDGSSNDISRIIRADYSDPFYAWMAKEAIDVWKADSLYSPHFYQNGLLMSSEVMNDPYLKKTIDNVRSKSSNFQELGSIEEIKKSFPGLQETQVALQGYINFDSGWADAAGAVKAVADRLTKLGVSFITGPRGTLQSLIIDENSRVTGVHVKSGPPLHASRVILATGAWTSRYLDLDHTIVGSAQALGYIQLTQEEVQRLADIPVTINMTTGVFFFPPSSDNILKVAYHGHGLEVAVQSDDKQGRVISAPQRDSDNAASGRFPPDMDAYLRSGLKQFLPEIAERPWTQERLCWYTETPTGNFIADYHHDIAGLFVATGGSGHGFKFLPVLGKYIADCFLGTATDEVQQRWKLPPHTTKKVKISVDDGSRRGPPRRLLDEMERAKL